MHNASPILNNNSPLFSTIPIDKTEMAADIWPSNFELTNENQSLILNFLNEDIRLIHEKDWKHKLSINHPDLLSIMILW